VQVKLSKRFPFFSRLFDLYCVEEIDFEELRKFKGIVRLSGYFQTQQITEFARKRYPNMRLQPKKPSKRFVTAMNQINGDFCAIHIRRGDYLHKGSIHSHLNSDYYYKALRQLGEETKDKAIKYVLFSDEPDIALKLLPIELSFINAAEFNLSAVEEFCLMSQANAFVIANSTFSFWPAYLAGKECPVVVPKKWFISGDESINKIMPNHWILISN
jgi:Glycosyl transferase family 11